MLLNEQNGYFHQVPGWNLNCAVVGAALTELSLLSRIDTDIDSLSVYDSTETGDPALDPILNKIADDPVQRNAEYWVEHLTDHADTIIELTLTRLVERKILKHHDGEFWTLNHAGQHSNSGEDAADPFIKVRISETILTNRIPHPRDAIIICLLNTCDVFRFIYDLDDQARQRIDIISKMDRVGRAIANAVKYNMANPLFRRSRLSKKIPSIALRHLLFNPHLRTGNIPAVFADLAKKHGPVFQFRPPFQEPMTVLAGVEVNRNVHRNGRMYLRTRDYFTDLEKVYRSSGLIPSLDGSDHFRLRKAMQPGYSRKRLEGRLDSLYGYIRTFMAQWETGSTLHAASTCRLMINSQVSPLTINIESQDFVQDLIQFKERALITHVAKILPKFMLHTPNMKRASKAIETGVQRILNAHTPAQRVNCPRDLADDLLSLYASDPQLLPESNLSFSLSAPMLASMYLGDALGFALWAMASQPGLYDKIRSEADALFGNGDPDAKDLTNSAIDVTRRCIMECMRMYPIVPLSIRNVMNSYVIEGYELPLGERVIIAQTSTHYMSDLFPEPFTFDIDRYLPPRNEHRSPGYAPYGLGTHTCLGFRWANLQLAVNLLMIAHYFTLKVSPPDYKLTINPFPSLSPSNRLKFHIAEQRRELPDQNSSS